VDLDNLRNFMSYVDILKAQLVVDEGRRNKMYLDSKKIPSIGIGHNLRDKPISNAAVDQIFADDVADSVADIRKLFTFDELSDNRKAVVLNMMFNLGLSTFSQFVNTIAAVNRGDYAAAATGMLASLWARQVGDRAERLAKLMKEG
jgi:lysozyme